MPVRLLLDRDDLPGLGEQGEDRAEAGRDRRHSPV
jgi:hypothetical protein